MTENKWRVSAGPHQGGHGDRKGNDKTMHITLTVYAKNERNSYHLRLDRKGHLFQITGKGMPETKPWTAI
ncbi:MAG: hypothetical protein B6D61_09835 [Bacteroidetes bacterium 4484_249]|nr:MAG: hypothetical protein B6D61_09835 [Bacteroidetes bacterium 4484_249]